MGKVLSKTNGKTRIKIDCVYLEVWSNTSGDNKERIEIENLGTGRPECLELCSEIDTSNYWKPIDLTIIRLFEMRLLYSFELCTYCSNRLAQLLRSWVRHRLFLVEPFSIAAGTLTQSLAKCDRFSKQPYLNKRTEYK